MFSCYDGHEATVKFLLGMHFFTFKNQATNIFKMNWLEHFLITPDVDSGEIKKIINSRKNLEAIYISRVSLLADYSNGDSVF